MFVQQIVFRRCYIITYTVLENHLITFFYFSLQSFRRRRVSASRKTQTEHPHNCNDCGAAETTARDDDDDDNDDWSINCHYVRNVIGVVCAKLRAHSMGFAAAFVTRKRGSKSRAYLCEITRGFSPNTQIPGRPRVACMFILESCFAPVEPYWRCIISVTHT